MGARLTKVACSQSSLLTFMGATVIRHGQDPDGSGQVGHATRRGTGVPPVILIPIQGPEALRRNANEP